MHNRIGPVGAWLADVLFFLFGRPAFLFPLMLGARRWVLFRRIQATRPARAANTRGAHRAGFLLVLFASCGADDAALEPGSLRADAPAAWSGSSFGNGLAAGLNFLGATLLLIAAWMAGLSLAFGVSWLTIIDRLGAAAWGGVGWLRARSAASRGMSRKGANGKQARKEAVKAEQKKSATRAPPRIEPPAPVVEKSERVEKERQVPLFDPPKAGELPPLKLLDDPPPREPLLFAPRRSRPCRAWSRSSSRTSASRSRWSPCSRARSSRASSCGRRPGVKASQITALAKDLARSLSVLSVRVVEVIPGKIVMGLEIPNEKREIVTLGEIIKSKAYDEMHSPLALALGKDIGGQPMVADLASMPHLLIAGTTGSGKSVGINAMVLSLLYKSHRRARAADHDRPEDAGALGLRGHPAPARAGGHGHEAGRQCAALVRGGDGAALPAHGGARRAQHRRLQPQGEGRASTPASRSAIR